MSSRRIIVACSGGMDSVVLLAVLAKLQSRLGFGLEVASVHHGPSTSSEVCTAREAALNCVRADCQRRKLIFHELRGELRLNSEESYRTFRYEQLVKLAVARNATTIALAHHADDLFETRLIRLIRGTGPQGLTAMRELAMLGKLELYRPFLTEARGSLRDYARGLEWIEDPTNSEFGPLRNWLRGKWLKELEAVRPGASAAFARSLSQIIQATHGKSSATRIQISFDGKFSRAEFQALESELKAEKIAALLRRLKIKSFTTRHVKEIQKRLETRRLSFEFEILRLKWKVNARHIQVQPRVP